jgi:hypothetical protein
MTRPLLAALLLLVTQTGCATVLTQGPTPFEVTVDSPAPGANVQALRLDTRTATQTAGRLGRIDQLEGDKLVSRPELRAQLWLDRRSDYRISVRDPRTAPQDVLVERYLGGEIFLNLLLASGYYVLMSVLPQAYGPQPANAAPFCALGVLAVGVGVDLSTGNAWRHRSKTAYFDGAPTP